MSGSQTRPYKGARFTVSKAPSPERFRRTLPKDTGTVWMLFQGDKRRRGSG